MNFSTQSPYSTSIIIWTLSLFAILLLFSSIMIIQNVEAKYVFSKKWGSEGQANGQFQEPRGITVDNAGNVYVADSGNDRIQKFKLANPCPSGTSQIVPGVCFVKAWGTRGSGNGQFKIPVDVATDSSGKVYVLDNGNGRIQVFQASGTFITKWGSQGSADAQFDNPFGIATDSSGDVYVADNLNNRIQKFKLANPCPTGTSQIVPGVCLVTKWGTHGTGNGQFDTLSGIGVDMSGNIYVSDFGNDRIQMFTGNGIFIKSWGSPGSGDGQFELPVGISVDRFGFVYVADAINFRIQKFELTPNPCPQGTTEITFQVCFVTKWGSIGSGDGQFIGLSDVYIGPSGVYVTDFSNHRIQQFIWKTDVGETGGAGGGTSPNIAVK